MMMKNISIGIDLGGTRIKALAMSESGEILHQSYQPTNDGNDSVWKNAVATAVEELQAKLNGAASVIGISAPGLPNTDNSAIAFMPGRMQGLENFYGPVS
jgi:glucokinase